MVHLLIMLAVLLANGPQDRFVRYASWRIPFGALWSHFDSGEFFHDNGASVWWGEWFERSLATRDADRSLRLEGVLPVTGGLQLRDHWRSFQLCQLAEYPTYERIRGVRIVWRGGEDGSECAWTCFDDTPAKIFSLAMARFGESGWYTERVSAVVFVEVTPP